MDFYQVPLGFGMALTRNFNAMNAYSAMTDEQKKAVLERAHNARSEKEMNQTVDSLVRNHESDKPSREVPREGCWQSLFSS